MEPTEVEIARKLARALDQEDYESARSWMEDDCVYEIRGETIVGADKIIASYRENAEAGRDRFDSVCFESSVSSIGDGRVRIDYTDIVTRSGDTLIHRCAQLVEFGESDQACRIVHEDLEGEREALEAFKASHP